MTEKLRPCPFCGGEAKLQLTDDEGNFKDESYLENPYSTDTQRRIESIKTMF